MIRNYIVIATRNLLNTKLYSFINILGLSIGIACCLVVCLFLLNEFGYDRFNANAKNIWRVVSTQSGENQDAHIALTQGILGPELGKNFPEIRSFTRVGFLREAISVEGKKPEEARIMGVDPAFFSVFTLPLKAGSGSSLSYQSMLLSESAAERIFGKTDPLGKTISVAGLSDVKVSGIYYDFPQQSHIGADFIISFEHLEKNPHTLSWNFNSHYTYLLMPDDLDAQAFGKKIDAFINPHLPDSWRTTFHYSVQPLLDIHGDSRYRGNARPAMGSMLKIIMSAVGTVILVLACLNYMNMATARSAKRSLEVGVRKVMGAYRLQLVHQFLSESLIVCTISFCLGILWADLAVPAFNAFTGWKLNMSSFFTDYRLVLTLAAFNVLLAIVAGSYPAFFLSRFIPAKVLKGQTSADASRRLRKGLVLAQFSITTVLVVMVIVVFRQFNYLRTKDLGFDKGQLLLFDASLGQNLSSASFKEELKQKAGVEMIASASSFPGSGLSNTEMRPSLAPDKSLQIDWMFADHDYIPTLRLKLLSGRNFHANGNDQDRGVIINAQAAASFGWKPEEAIGKKVSGFIFTDSLPGEVIGVIANFHVTSLKKEMSPLVIGYQSSGEAFIARLGAGNIFEARNTIEKTVTRLVPGTIFDAMFMDDFIEQMYMSEKKTGQMIGFFTVLAILVGCSGLFALSAYEGEQRVKELGIRKIMGATPVQLIVMLSKNFLKLVGLSLIISFPLAYFVTGLWLQPFPYRISWSADIFLLAGAAILLLAWMTVITQAIRSSRLNPADALRHE